jgi:hypothetical protein
MFITPKSSAMWGVFDFFSIFPIACHTRFTLLLSFHVKPNILITAMELHTPVSSTSISPGLTTPRSRHPGHNSHPNSRLSNRPLRPSSLPPDPRTRPPLSPGPHPLRHLPPHKS